jgi:hypothetical protein
MTTYYITCPGNTNFWEKTKAKTLRGAKALATKTWQVSMGSKLIVAAQDRPDGQMYELARKYGYDKWVNV